MSYLIKLDMFEGPFDLLLSLIERHEIDIMDIPIAQIAEEYLNSLQQMQEMDLVISGDFLVMAATLLQIKAKMLLPKKRVVVDDEELEEDPRSELVERLLEYKFYKQAAQMLNEFGESASEVYPRSASQVIEKSPVFLNPVGATDIHILTKLFAQVLDATTETEQVHHIKRAQLSVPESIVKVRLTLLKHKRVRFSDLLVSRDKFYIIVTFLAILELVRMHEIRAVQDEDFSDIELVAIPSDEGGVS